MTLIIFLSMLFIFQNSSAYIFYLNESEYVRVPPIFHLDPYEACIHKGNDAGVYCSVKFNLVTDESSELYNTIKDYSAKTESHFNHTDLFYGICLTKTWKQLYERNTTKDLASSLEEYLNQSFEKEYGLKIRVDKYTCDDSHSLNLKLDSYDIAVATIISVLLLLNFVGSLQEIFCKNKNNKGQPLLFCFSIRQNWRRLVISSEENLESRLTRLKGIHGLKVIFIIFVISVHSLLPCVVNAENPRFFEEIYRTWYYQVIISGSVVVQSFFVISGFLLAYNMQRYLEKQKVTWLAVLKCVILRYIRLLGPYAVVLVVAATWMRHLGTGPLWQSVVMTEVDDCRRDWWLNLLYVNNYIDYSNCMTPTWYLAANFQLYVIGVVLCAITSIPLKKIIWVVWCTTAVVVPATLTYLWDLDGILIFSPETTRYCFIKDDTFNNIYKRGHTNLAPFGIGLMIGQLAYKWQTSDYEVKKTVKQRIMVWLTIPAMAALCLLGSVFFRDAPRASIYIRTLYAAFLKPVFSAVVAFLIFGMMFQFEDTYRGILEWPGWVVPSRVSYCAYLIHFLIIRYLTGTLTTLTHISILNMFSLAISSICFSFTSALLLHLLVEAPTKQLIKERFNGSMTS